MLNPIHAVTDEIDGDVASALEIGAELGIGGYVLRMSRNRRFPDWDVNDLKLVEQEVAAGRIKVDAISCGFFKEPYPGGDPEKVIEPAIAALGAAARVGATKFVCFAWAKPPGWQPLPEAILAPEFPEAIVRGFQELADEAARMKIRVLIEVGYQTWCDTGYGLLELLRRIDRPNVGAVYDPSNAVAGRVRRGTAHGQPVRREMMPVLLDEIRQLGPHLEEVHVRDMVWDEQDYHYVPLGEGWLDWPAMLGALQAAEYEGPLTIEHHLPAKPEMARHTHAALKRMQGEHAQSKVTGAGAGRP